MYDPILRGWYKVRSLADFLPLAYVPYRHSEIAYEDYLRELMISDDRTAGQRAFEAYCGAMDGITYDGKPIPIWQNLPDNVKVAWQTAAQANNPVTVWLNNFDERQRAQISFARLYASNYHHGADGHNNMLIISKMADLLDAIK